MRILSIETSCDDTGITLLEAKGAVTSASFKILANNLSSQVNIHAPFGGVYPMLAKREHIKNLPILLEKTLSDAKLSKKNILKPFDAIAVTYGPGLEPSLWTGINFAQDLARKYKVPLIPVNHMEGHILSVFGTSDKKTFKIPKIKAPLLALLVSGGHTELVLCKKLMNYKIIGETVDDAVGEAFDKVARMLGLPYPGGPEISRLAETLRKNREVLNEEGLASATARAGGISQQRNIRAESGQNFAISLPRPMLKSKDFNFSFSGLKTAVLYLIRDLGKIDDKIKSEIALEFENAAIECLTAKTAKALDKSKAKTLIIGGGVAANKYLRKEMKKITRKKVKLFFPTPHLSTDNSIMIGIAGYLNFIKNKKKVPKISTIKAVGNLRLAPRESQ